MRVYDHIWQTIGRTPLVRAPNLAQADGVVADLLLKLEFFSPLSSVKDRLALALIEAGEAEGKIREGGVVIEPTSGNTGIALAFICAAKKYRLILTMPESMSYERRKMLRLFGAEIVLTPADEGMAGAIARAEALAAEHPGSYMPRQFSHPANPAIHRQTTAEEIWQDTDGQVDMVVVGVGTGGTLTGIAQGLRPRKPTVRIVAVEPSESRALTGGPIGAHKIQGIGTGFVSDVLDISQIDEIFHVTSEEAIATARRAARVDGLPLGLSGGAALHAGLKIGQRVDMKDKKIVILIPGMAERYLSLPAFRDLE